MSEKRSEEDQEFLKVEIECLITTLLPQEMLVNGKKNQTELTQENFETAIDYSEEVTVILRTAVEPKEGLKVQRNKPVIERSE